MARGRTLEGNLDASGRKFALVVSRWNSLITERLLEGAEDTLIRHGAAPEDILVLRAPGAFELPLLARRAAKHPGVEAVVALGCVIRGATPHFEYVASEVAKGVGQVSLETGVPVAFGVLTTDTIEQAIERAGMKAGNKGSEAATAAIEMLSLFAALDADGA